MNGYNRDDLWVGLDIGGTKIAAALVSFPQAQPLAHLKTLTEPTRRGQAILQDCLNLVNQLKDASPAPIRGIGIGIAELVDRDGNLTSAATIPWLGMDVRAAFTTIAPTVLEADVRAAALGEAQFGAGKNLESFAYITVGTGISACLVQNGVPYAGARGNALLLGNSILNTDTDAPLVLERVASGSALVERYNKLAMTLAHSGEDVVRAMYAGDAAAKRVLQEAGDALGLGIALYVNLLDPEAVIVGGGLGSADGYYWERAVATARTMIYAENARSIPIVHGALGANAGVLGAAAVARQHFKQPT